MKLDIKIALLALIGVTMARTSIPRASTMLKAKQRAATVGSRPVVVTDPRLIRAPKNSAPAVETKAANSTVPAPPTGGLLVQTGPKPLASAQSGGVTPASLEAGRAALKPTPKTEKPASTGFVPSVADLLKGKAALKPVSQTEKPVEKPVAKSLADMLAEQRTKLKPVKLEKVENKTVEPSEDTNALVKLLADGAAKLRKTETREPKSPLELYKEEMEQKKKAEEEAKLQAEVAAIQAKTQELIRQTLAEPDTHHDLPKQAPVQQTAPTKQVAPVQQAAAPVQQAPAQQATAPQTQQTTSTKPAAVQSAPVQQAPAQQAPVQQTQQAAATKPAAVQQAPAPVQQAQVQHVAEVKPVTSAAATSDKKTDTLQVAQVVGSTIPASGAASSHTHVPTQTTTTTTTAGNTTAVGAPTKTEQGSLKVKEVFRHEHVHNHYHHFIHA